MTVPVVVTFHLTFKSMWGRGREKNFFKKEKERHRKKIRRLENAVQLYNAFLVCKHVSKFIKI